VADIQGSLLVTDPRVDREQQGLNWMFRDATVGASPS
jgi:hypothetical protein